MCIVGAMAKQRNNLMRAHKKLVILASALLIILVLVIGFLVYRQIVVSEMRNLADEFPTNQSWVLKYDIARAPDACIDTECPSYSRIWELPSPLTESNVDDLTTQGAHGAPVETINRSFDDAGRLTVYEKQYTEKGYYIVIKYIGRTQNTNQELSLNIKK